ncbi:MAG TPA: phosphonate ABC transporter, permease protein PhnE [Devosia sp.]|nr:phosphonate ABC transporter, permease protein PhnE [Devosia sp.]
MSHELTALTGQPWKKPAFISSPLLRWGLLIVLLVYLFFAFSTIEVNWARIYRGLDRGWQFIVGFANPDFVSRGGDILEGLLESVVMTVASTVAGIAISIPIALGGARNIAPLPVYAVCRFIIAISRALNEIIVAIIMVKIFGFGPLAGFLTLSFATIGFLSKLLAEDIEAMSMSAPEAIQSTGASWLQWINYGVQPQVMPRLVGLSMYRLDINFRESAVLGLVGAGGIGATLNTAFDRYEFDSVAAILLIIILTVMVLETLSGVIRERIQ